MNTQLTSALSYNTKNIRFSKPAINSIPGSTPPVTYKRIYVNTLNPDGTLGDLILETSTLFSYGVSENTNIDNGAVNGYVMPLCLWNKDGATKDEEKFVTTFTNIVEACKKHLMDEKDELELYELEDTDLKKFNPLYWKKDKGKVVEGKGPTLYCKLITRKQKESTGFDIMTSFFDSDTGENIDPSLIIGKYCNVKAAVKIESIFIGNKISLQVKLYEADVKLFETGMRRLLSRPVRLQRQVQMSGSVSVDKALESGYGSVEESEDEEEFAPSFDEPKKKSPVSRRRVAKK
jgi:hypothetical protein